MEKYGYINEDLKDIILYVKFDNSIMWKEKISIIFLKIA